MMTVLINILATVFFLSMLAFGVGVCAVMVRNHGQQMLAALMGRPFDAEIAPLAEVTHIEPRSMRPVAAPRDWRDEGIIPLAA